jgi:type IV secretion system protein VirD4
VRLWFFVQDISQLQLHYRNSWRSFFSNTGTQCFFGVSDITTANLVSEMSGITTVDNHNTSFGHTATSTGTNLNFFNQPIILYDPIQPTTESTANSITHSYTSRRLITPDEVMRMRHNDQIIFMKGLEPIYCNLLGYYEIPRFSDLVKNYPPPKPVDFE